jgi:serine/threonine protein kinase
MSPPSTASVVASLGEVFAVFDQRTQDSGNVSYGVRATDGRRFFVKTAGSTEISAGGLTRAQRVGLLRLDAQLHADVEHPALVALHDVVETSDGIAVIYDWFDGELLNSPAERRNDPAEAYQRFASLPSSEIVDALDSVIDLHVALETAGWVAGDFYDGCLMYNFAARQIKVMDFECYRRGAYVNDKGRLPGSTRFMAPEEFARGATIDARTTVFNLGRMVREFLLRRNDLANVRPFVARATADEPSDRYLNVAALYRAWQEITDRRPGVRR